MNNVIIYTDGAARGNPNGPGGYGVVLEYTDKTELSIIKNYHRVTKKPPITVWNLWQQSQDLKHLRLHAM